MKRIILILFSISMLLSLVACGKPADPWQEQYDLGVRYLSEGNYEEAIIAFTAAIEIDPKREEAYVGLADVYYVTGDNEKAEEILEQYSERGDMAIGEFQEEETVSITTRTERVDFDDGSYNIYEYDASGKMIRGTDYNADNAVSCYRVYDYNSTGYLVLLTIYYADGTIGIVHEYDDLGNKVRSTWYDSDGVVIDVEEN